MNHPELNSEPLTTAECERLDALLGGFPHPNTMTVEAMDGFFNALLCVPGSVLDHYLPEVWGGEAGDEPTPPAAQDEVSEFLALCHRYWQVVSQTLASGEPYLPRLASDENGEIHGNEWAEGFFRGVEVEAATWAEFCRVNGEGPGAMLLLMALAREHDPDPSSDRYRELLSGTPRDRIIATAAMGVSTVYQLFRLAARRKLFMPNDLCSSRPPLKVGRNDPCPCGSGKKYKRCCGAVT